MADIAMLVAEEYERRVKSSRQSGEEIELLSCVGIMGKNLKGPSFSWIKEKIIFMEGAKIKVWIPGKKDLEPKYQMSLAATNGFFSA